jgi:hypothetical protein
MKEKLSWFDKMMAAVTFAEANEHHAGKEFLTGTGRRVEKKEKCKECDAILTPDMHGAEVR